MSTQPSLRESIMGYEQTLPDDFLHWTPAAKRAWLTGGFTQRQMLNYACDELGIDIEYSPQGRLTNRELARFVVAVTEGGEVGASDLSL